MIQMNSECICEFDPTVDEERRVYTCPECGNKYYSDESVRVCRHPSAKTFFGMTTEQISWFREVFKSNIPIDPLDIRTYPCNRARRRDNELLFWGDGYNFITWTVRHIPINIARIRMITSLDAMSQFSRKDVLEITKGNE